MQTVICGATGMVGSHLAKQLHAKGQSLILVGRDANKMATSFSFDITALTWDELARADATEIATIVNLTGAGVSDQTWTAEYKKLMRDSRLTTTQQCVQLCERNPDIRLLNASAVSAYGFYEGDHNPFTEQDRDRRTGSNFLQQLIDDWEEAALKAQTFGNAVVLLRIGVVLDRKSGGLPAMAKPFELCFGGPAGSGKQMMSWISLRDLVNGIEFLIEHAEITGPVNLVSTGACNQRAFAKALGSALHKPSFIPTPAFMIEALMGEMGKELVLAGQRVKPALLLKEGFVFQDTEINTFLQSHYQLT